MGWHRYDADELVDAGVVHIHFPCLLSGLFVVQLACCVLDIIYFELEEHPHSGDCKSKAPLVAVEFVNVALALAT